MISKKMIENSYLHNDGESKIKQYNWHNFFNKAIYNILLNKSSYDKCGWERAGDQIMKVTRTTLRGRSSQFKFGNIYFRLKFFFEWKLSQSEIHTKLFSSRQLHRFDDKLAEQPIWTFVRNISNHSLSAVRRQVGCLAHEPIVDRLTSWICDVLPHPTSVPAAEGAEFFPGNTFVTLKI